MLQSEKTILLVEDDTSTRLIINRGIANWGCKVLSVSSGEEALRVSSMITPDLALIDISLPGIDGVTLANILIQKQVTAIILMTADRNHTANKELLGHKVICKPFKIHDLREIVSKTSFVFDQEN